MEQLELLYNSGRYAELESRARLLTEQYPNVSLAWEVLSSALQMQGKVVLAIFEKITELEPNNAEAHSNLGNAQQNLGRLNHAVASFHRALEINPDSAEVHCNLGVVLHAIGRLDDAIASFQRALEIKPDFTEVHCNLAVVLRTLGRLDDAAASIHRALEINPDHAEAHNNLGVVLRDLGQQDGAGMSFQRALKINPDFAEAHNNLGQIQIKRGTLNDAVASCRRSLQLNPNLAEAHNNLGNALKALGQLDDAEASYRRALEINPNFAEVYNNLGCVLRAICQHDNAVACFRRALEIIPDFAEAHSNLGNALRDLGQNNNAVTSYRRALEIKPDFAQAYSNLGGALQNLGQYDNAVASYRRALEINPDFSEAHSNLLFNCNYQPKLQIATLLSEARRFGSLAAKQTLSYTDWSNPPDPGRRLRVGFISGDLCDHPVGFFLESVLKALASNSSSRLELIAYPSHLRADEVSERLKTRFHEWRPVIGLSDETLARKIRDDGIDILIDLSGHTSHNRLPLFTWKPAPVQASWLGYFATTGVAAIDYLIADPWTVPEAEEAHFSEKVWRLPETYLCFTPPDVNLSVSPLPALTTDLITFGCFNNLNKMNDAVVALWARVLLAVPGSQLFLKTKQLNDVIFQHRVVERFAVHGIDAGRLILEGAAPRAELLAAYNRVDIALDPFPYPGGTTSVEALWMGVPVLSLAGDRFLSHIGESILQNAGLPEWIATDADDYVARAVSHTRDLQHLAALRNGLRQQVLASPIFDAPRFARHFEAALRGMWVQWCDQQQLI